MPASRGPICDVALIGFGPVGAALAALLGLRQRQVEVFDAAETIYPLPRAFALDHEAMRLFQEIGITDTLDDHLARYRPTLYLGVDGQPIQHFDMGPPPYPLGWAPGYTFNQPALEARLRARVDELASVTVHLGQQVTGHRERDDHVELDVRAADGTTRTARARFVVACDGGRSDTRKRLGLSMKSLDFDEPWVVVDLRVEPSALATLPETNIQFCNPARPCTHVIGPGNHRRWEFLLNPDEAERAARGVEMPQAEVWAMLAPWLSPTQARIWRHATYRFHAVVVERWRQGRILLAGDAAHQMPPFLAQGMCQGLRDASNLAWKLDWVLRKQAPITLLDSYGDERGPQVEAVTATVKRLGLLICERDRDRALARDASLREQQGGTVRMQLRQGLLPGITGGLIRPPSPPAGMPFPQPDCRVAGSDTTIRMDDLLALARPTEVAPINDAPTDHAPVRGFVLVTTEAPAPEQLDDWQQIFPSLQVAKIRPAPRTPTEQPAGRSSSSATTPITLQMQDPILMTWFDTHRCIAALVRPDHIVYGVADRLDTVAALLTSARTQLTAGAS